MKNLYLLSLSVVFIFLFQSCSKKEDTIRELSSSGDSSKKTDDIVSVKIILSPPDAPNKIQKNSEKIKRGVFTSPSMVYRKLQEAPQQFDLNPTRDTVLKCAQGTLVEIKANSFLLHGKECTTLVSLFIKECYHPEDMVLANLSTVSNHRLLESGGMIHLEAFSQTQPLTLQKNKAIGLKMPAEATKPYMQLFYANNDSNGTMNWLQASDSKPQFAQITNTKKNRKNNLKTGNYFINNRGYGTVTTTVNIVKDGKERELSTTSYANESLFEFTLDTSSLSFEMEENGIVSNTVLSDNSINRGYKIKAQRLESMSSFSMVYYPYTPGNLRFTDCTLLFKTSLIEGKGAEPSFIVPRHDYTAIKNGAAQKNGKIKVIVRNTYTFISNGSQDRMKNFKEKLDSAGNNLKDISAGELEYYVFNINQMGWINCDRFYNVPAAQKINFTVHNPEGAEVKLVFSDMRSVMNGSVVGDQTTFYNIPENKAVALVGVRIVQGRAQLAILKTTTKKVSEDKLEYTTVSVDEMKEKIKTAL